jgi:hypothetical protein
MPEALGTDRSTGAGDPARLGDHVGTLPASPSCESEITHSFSVDCESRYLPATVAHRRELDPERAQRRSQAVRPDQADGDRQVAPYCERYGTGLDNDR